MSKRQELENNKIYILTEIKNGRSSRSIAKELKFDTNYFNEIMRQWGISRKRSDIHSTAIKEEIVKRFQNGQSMWNIHKEMKLPTSVVTRAIKKMGLNNKDNNKQKEREFLIPYSEDIVQKYKIGYSTYKLSLEYKCSAASIIRVLQLNKIVVKSLPKYTYDEKFFETVDSAEKAWALGLYFTDGSNDIKRKRIQIYLIDLDCIQKLKNLIKYTGNIIPKKPKNEKYKVQYGLKIGSKKLSEDLYNLGCTDRKTYTLEFPREKILSKQYYADFCRGAWDGDGCIYIRKNKQVTISLVGTKSFCLSVKDVIKNELDIDMKTSIHNKNIKNGHETWLIRTSSYSNCKKLLDWLYKDATIYMQRKYDKYQEFLTYYKEKYPSV